MGKSLLYPFICFSAIFFFVMGIVFSLVGCNPDVSGGCATAEVHNGFLSNKTIGITGCDKTVCYSTVFVFNYGIDKCAIIYNYKEEIEANQRYDQIEFGIEYRLLISNSREENKFIRCNFYSDELKNIWITGISFLSVLLVLIIAIIICALYFTLRKQINKPISIIND